jgi:hypothetical protein
MGSGEMLPHAYFLRHLLNSAKRVAKDAAFAEVDLRLGWFRNNAPTSVRVQGPAEHRRNEQHAKSLSASGQGLSVVFQANCVEKILSGMGIPLRKDYCGELRPK